MLLDILGIAIAFVSVILLLSILVTAVVQFLQAGLHLRARNLRTGLADLIRKMDLQPEGSEAVSVKRALELSDSILADPSISLIAPARRSANAEGAKWRDKIMGALMGPGVSWVEADKLKGAAKRILDGSDDAAVEEGEDALREKEKGEKAEKLARSFQDAQPLLQNRFKFQIRLWTFGIALAVAFAFQVSAPRLLVDLSRDAERRNAIAAGAERLLVSAEGDIERLDVEDAAIEALQVLQVRFPDQRHLIAQASGVGTTQLAVVEELNLALEGSPKRSDIVAEYRELLNDLVREQMGTALEIAQNARTKLGEYGVFLWPEKWGFYFDNEKIEFGTIKVDAWLGVFLTAILLSLGAPFWFEMLRNLVKLRDVLSGKAGTSSKPQDVDGAAEDKKKPTTQDASQSG